MFTALQATIGLEIAVLVIVFVLLLGTYIVLKAFKPLIVNALLGLVVIVIADAIGYGIEVTLLVVLIVALGGIPAALLVLLLAHLDVAFETTAAIFPPL